MLLLDDVTYMAALQVVLEKYKLNPVEFRKAVIDKDHKYGSVASCTRGVQAEDDKYFNVIVLKDMTDEQRQIVGMSPS